MCLLISFSKMIRTCILIAVFAITFQCGEVAGTEDDKVPALVFNRLTGSVFDLPSEISKKSRCGPWTKACPATSKYDLEFVAQNALTENPLVVKQICTKDRIIKEQKFEKNTCSTPFKISVLFNKKNFTFDFGYEVYVSKEFWGSIFWHNFRSFYVPVKKLFKSLREKAKKSKYFMIREYIHFVFDGNNAFSHYESSKMLFYWASIFEIQFDFERWTPMKIFYQIRNNNRWPVTFSCKNYDLAEEPKDKTYIYVNYSKTHQQMTFDPYILPDESSSAACDNVCLKQWLLIPIDQFHFGSLKKVSCPHMATVPIWKSTLELVVMKVDKFLYALFKAVGSGLHVVSGTRDQLKLMKKITENTSNKKSKSKSHIYLDMVDKNIPVPEIIYKLVKYKLDDCPKVGQCWYSAVIVIHNNPYFDPKNKICPDVTTEWGWTEVTKFNLPGSTEQPIVSKYVYVCKCDQEVLRTLMGASWLDEPQKMGDFDLFKVPLNGAKKGMLIEPVARDVLQKLLELTERERKLNTKRLKVGSEADADVSDEGMEDDDDGEIKPAAKDDKKGSDGRKRKQSSADPAAFNKNDIDTTRTSAKDEGISAPIG